MKSNLTYAGLMDAEILKRFFEGKLTSEENDYFTTLLADDELLREAFAGLSSEGFEVVQSISNSTNSKIDKMIGKAPLFQRWTFWLSIFIGVVLISFIAYQLFPEGGGQKSNSTLVASGDKEKSKKERKNQITEKKKTENKKETELVTEQNHSSDNTLTFQSDDKRVLSMSDLKKPKDTVKNNVVNTDGVNDGPDDKKVADHKTQTNPNTVDPGINPVKKKIRLRLSDAMVSNSQNLAEKEASSGDNNNHDVRNPNIGNAATTKKSNSFNLEDMPQYPGGTDALNAYVKGKLAIKSYSLDKNGISTMVEFVVTSKGKVEDIKIQNQLDPAMEKDIREVLSNLKFNPGKKSGKKGSMYYMMALTYN